MARSKGKAICVFSAKGGTGKTVLTLNLAGLISKLNKKVLIIDLDLAGGGIALALNTTAEKSIHNINDDLNNNSFRSIKEYVTKYNSNIDFLASPRDPRNASKIDAKYIDLIIEDAKSCYDVVLIDTNHILSPINLVMLDKVDDILFMITNDPFTFKNMKTLIRILKSLNFDNFKVILNNAIGGKRDYFSVNDIKNIIKVDIDFVLDSNYYLKNIDDLIINGQIFTLNEKSLNTSTYGDLLKITTNVLKDDKEKNNEKK